MKKLLALILALVMALALVSCGGSGAPAGGDKPADNKPAAGGDEIYNVSIQFSFPEEAAGGVKEVLNSIEEASNGRIKFEIYYSFSFVDAGDVIDALQTNQLNVAAFMPTDYSIFALNGRVVSQPLMNYPSWEAACKIYLSEVYGNEAMMKEYTDNGLVFWSAYMCPGYQYFTSAETTTTDPSIFNGQTVMCDNSTMSTFISNNKGGAITVFPTDFLSNLQNGVAEALMQHVNCAYVFGCFDYTKTAIFFGEGGFYNFPLNFAFSEQFWNSLPEDLQQIFADHAVAMAQKGFESDCGLYNNAAMPKLQENATIITLDDAQIAEWQAAIADTVDAAIADIAKDNAAAPDVYNELKDKIANYDPETFDIGTTNFGTDANWS